MTECICVNMHRQVQLGGVLYGLKNGNGGIEPDPCQFPCCEASGTRILPDKKIEVRCDFAWRLRHVRELDRQHSQLWNRSFNLTKLNELPSVKILTHLDIMFKGTAAGRIVWQKPYEGAGAFWTYALASTWRFGVKTHFVSFNKTPVSRLLPPNELSLGRRDPDRPSAIFVERISGLHDPGLAFDLESIISYAYLSKSYLFLEFNHERIENHGLANVHVNSSTKGYFSRRISKMQKQNPLKFLRADCVSRLEDLCGSINLSE